ncbi:MAG: fasciclin domain-containing protein [Phycisphaerales bacterium]|jgi:transforming growth factor-beta-induced protein|nr:MAG: fasciclin domain-containing protein [Phycisphaerales bacterium]
MRTSALISITAAAALSAGAFAGGTCTPSAPVATTVQYQRNATPDIVDTAVSAGSFNTLVAAVKAAGLVDVLKGDGPFTVFAPTDEAFAKLPAGTVESLLKPENRDTLVAILTYHVVPGKVMASDVVNVKNAATVNGQRIDVTVNGGTVMIDGATVVSTDITASNGVIHVIDSVIMPSTSDIIETAVAAGRFTTLAAALDAAGLVSTLQGAGPFTVFAPTDEAFAKLPAGTVETLLKPENREMLTRILTAHVVPGRVYADQVVGMTSAKTVAGVTLPVQVRGTRVTIGGAAVIATDIDTTNGVIHVIDTVIIPGN